MTDTDAATALGKRVRELEAENARLRSATRKPVLSGSRWRTVVSAVCIVMASILVPLSVMGAWARVQLVDKEAFVAVFAPLIEEEAVQDLIVDETMSAISAKVDFAALTGEVFDGISELGLPPRASTALDLLRQPAADGLTNLVESTVTSVVASEVFSDTWANTLRGAHRAFTSASTSDGGGVIVLTPDGLGVEIGPLIEEIKANLSDRGVAAAALIPVVDRTVIIGDGEALVTVRTTYAIADMAGWWMPVATLALFILGIGVARRRSVAVLCAGVGIALGSGVLGVGLTIGASAMAIAAGGLDLSPAALDVIYAQVTGDIQRSAWAFFTLGIITAVIGWVWGPTAAAQRTRGGAEALNASMRRSLAARGFDTGRWGRWLAQYRVAVRFAIAVVVVAWLFLLPPASVGGVFIVLGVALAIAWLLELLQSRHETVA